jgi:YVTN family beta-propeller protein
MRESARKSTTIGAAIALVFAAVATVSGMQSPSRTAPGAAQVRVTPALPQQPDYLYVCNQDGASVSIVDMATLEVVKTLDLQKMGFSATAKPHHVVVEPDGSFWYLTLIGESKVLKLDRNNRIVGQAEFETPGLMTLLPKEHVLYVGRSMSAVNPPQRIGVINPKDMSIDEVDVFFPRPHALDSRPQGDYIYSASLAVNQLISLNTKTEATKLVSLEGPAHSLAHSSISPDGRWMVITTHMPHMIVFDLSDPASPKMTKMVSVGELPWYSTFTKDGAYVFVANNGTNDVSVVETKTWSVEKTITDPGLAQAYGVTLSPDGRYVFVTGNNAKGTYTPKKSAAQPSDVGTVVVIDVASRSVKKVIEVGKGPTGLGVRHTQ